MGGWKLPGSIFCGLALAAASVAAGCGGNSKGGPSPAASRHDATTTATASATRTPTATPTPDPLANAPANASEAQQGIEDELIASPAEACPARLVSMWKVTCAAGDFDRDGQPDMAFLVPLKVTAGTLGTPAVVLVLRSTTKTMEALADDGDASKTGVAFFTARTVPAGGQALAYLSTGCSATGCISQAHVERWDGTAWRDIGPGDAGITALESATWDQSGELVLEGGKLTAPGAGPTRSVTVTYAYSDGRYAESSRVYAAPVYLFHAITDADAKFAAADWAAAITAYQAAINNTSLKDWKAEQGQSPGRPTLVSYALFRIAIATAAEGNDPSVALDTVIVDAKDPIFAYAAQQFRTGWQQTGSVHGGCIAATAYLGTSNASGDNPAYIKQAFNYGYANQPIKTYMDVCPL